LGGKRLRAVRAQHKGGLSFHLKRETGSKLGGETRDRGKARETKPDGVAGWVSRGFTEGGEIVPRQRRVALRE